MPSIRELLDQRLARSRQKVLDHLVFQYISEKYHITETNMLNDCRHYCTTSTNWMNNPMHWQAEFEFKQLISAMIEDEHLLAIHQNGGDVLIEMLSN